MLINFNHLVVARGNLEIETNLMCAREISESVACVSTPA